MRLPQHLFPIHHPVDALDGPPTVPIRQAAPVGPEITIGGPVAPPRKQRTKEEQEVEDLKLARAQAEYQAAMRQVPVYHAPGVFRVKSSAGLSAEQKLALANARVVLPPASQAQMPMAPGMMASPAQYQMPGSSVAPRMPDVSVSVPGGAPGGPKFEAKDAPPGYSEIDSPQSGPAFIAPSIPRVPPPGYTPPTIVYGAGSPNGAMQQRDMKEGGPHYDGKGVVALLFAGGLADAQNDIKSQAAEGNFPAVTEILFSLLEKMNDPWLSVQKHDHTDVRDFFSRAVKDIIYLSRAYPQILAGLNREGRTPFEVAAIYKELSEKTEDRPRTTDFANVVGLIIAITKDSQALLTPRIIHEAPWLVKFQQSRPADVAPVSHARVPSADLMVGAGGRRDEKDIRARDEASRRPDAPVSLAGERAVEPRKQAVEDHRRDEKDAKHDVAPHADPKTPLEKGLKEITEQLNGHGAYYLENFRNGFLSTHTFHQQAGELVKLEYRDSDPQPVLTLAKCLIGILQTVGKGWLFDHIKETLRSSDTKYNLKLDIPANATKDIIISRLNTFCTRNNVPPPAVRYNGKR